MLRPKGSMIMIPRSYKKYLLSASMVFCLQLYWLVWTSRKLEINFSILKTDLSSKSLILPHTSNEIKTSLATEIIDQPSKIPIFYNLYVNPDNASDITRVRDLVSEQLAILATERYSPIFVQSIGQPMYVPNTMLLGHHPNGTEVLTLHSLWEFCQENYDKTVLYLHSKGSYHPRHENDPLRRFLTFGAVHGTSKQGNKIPDFCDVVSARFSPYPHPHTSGNMWLGRCDYLSKLFNPLEFAAKMEEVPRAPGLKRRFEYYLVGRKRFSAEHWVYSHPSVRPCDTYRGNFSCGYDNLPEQLVEKDFDSIEEAPRFPFKFYRPSDELKPWTGIVHRWEEYKVLYNETPTESWWGWKIEEWRKDFGQKWSMIKTKKNEP
ncbi:hypothetical protein IV203_008435 [Nitzschia inconspicua]|uniref:Uncharacterized protein n=1 Tax=Nitzschia inconspicua TaxID=303405 RepID=A0A9K3KZE4_9STRA|nr:hypothetical protein IV203_008435 [Nitzschia inconspicua]